VEPERRLYLSATVGSVASCCFAVDSVVIMPSNPHAPVGASLCGSTASRKCEERADIDAWHTQQGRCALQQKDKSTSCWPACTVIVIAARQHQGIRASGQVRAVSEHLQADLDEFSFRLKRRYRQGREACCFYRLLDQVVKGSSPARTGPLVAGPTSRTRPEAAAATCAEAGQCDSLAREPLGRPWRTRRPLSIRPWPAETIANCTQTEKLVLATDGCQVGAAQPIC
jgi:hypothetical protein